jgi:hypothetical protein
MKSEIKKNKKKEYPLSLTMRVWGPRPIGEYLFLVVD